MNERPNTKPTAIMPSSAMEIAAISCRRSSVAVA